MLPNSIHRHPTTLALGCKALCLRPWQFTDAELLVIAAQESVESVGRWLPWCRADYGLAEAESWIDQCKRGWRDGNQRAFAVIDKNDGALLGAAGLNQFNFTHRCASMGYWIRQSRQRSGLCTLAAARLAKFGFEQLNLIRIEIVTLPDNAASRGVATKIGARFETVARHRLWHDGDPRDGAVYGLIPCDLRQG